MPVINCVELTGAKTYHGVFPTMMRTCVEHLTGKWLCSNLLSCLPCAFCPVVVVVMCDGLREMTAAHCLI